jgi:hypothetical protein
MLLARRSKGVSEMEWLGKKQRLRMLSAAAACPVQTRSMPFRTFTNLRHHATLGINIARWRRLESGTAESGYRLAQ